MNFGGESSTASSDGLGSVFKVSVQSGVNFYRSTVETDCFNLDFDYTFNLQSFKNSFKNTIFAPSVHAYIHSMPVSIGFRQCS